MTGLTPSVSPSSSPSPETKRVAPSPSCSMPGVRDYSQLVVAVMGAGALYLASDECKGDWPRAIAIAIAVASLFLVWRIHQIAPQGEFEDNVEDLERAGEELKETTVQLAVRVQDLRGVHREVDQGIQRAGLVVQSSGATRAELEQLIQKAETLIPQIHALAERIEASRGRGCRCLIL